MRCLLNTCLPLASWCAVARAAMAATRRRSEVCDPSSPQHSSSSSTSRRAPLLRRRLGSRGGAVHAGGGGASGLQRSSSSGSDLLGGNYGVTKPDTVLPVVETISLQLRSWQGKLLARAGSKVCATPGPRHRPHSLFDTESCQVLHCAKVHPCTIWKMPSGGKSRCLHLHTFPS